MGSSSTSRVLLCVALSVLPNNQVSGCCYCRRLAESFAAEEAALNSTVGRRLGYTPHKLKSNLQISISYFGTAPGGKCTRNSNCHSGICRESVCLKTRVGEGCARGNSRGDCVACLSDYVMHLVYKKSESTSYKYCQICPAGTPRNKCVTGTIF